eukprot:2595428-Rhodomonas_salina.1
MDGWREGGGKDRGRNGASADGPRTQCRTRRREACQLEDRGRREHVYFIKHQADPLRNSPRAVLNPDGRAENAVIVTG